MCTHTSDISAKHKRRNSLTGSEGLVLSLTLLLGNPGGACVRAGSFTEGATNNLVGGDLT